MTTATLINFIVCDLLVQNGFEFAHLPELVDLAVVTTGLVLLQSNISLVKEGGHFWDSTQWETVPRPFLDRHGLAYSTAVAAWMRKQKDPSWQSDVPVDIKKPMKKSLKYLFKTADCFLQPDGGPSISSHSNNDWLRQAEANSKSQKIIGIRQLNIDNGTADQINECLLNCLRSADREIRLHAIATISRLAESDPSIEEELRMLATSRDDETRAKAVMTLARLNALDDHSTEIAARMLDSHARFVVYAGIYALTSLPAVPEESVEPANRGFVRALQTCDYDMISLFTTAWLRWEESPEEHFEALLKHDSPEYLELALESLASAREQMASTE